jgi:hypothetical protein
MIQRIFVASFAAVITGLLSLTVVQAVGSDGVWIEAPGMSIPHCLGNTIRLSNGKVLVTTGYEDAGNITARSELYDPITQTWTETGAVNQVRETWRNLLVNLDDGRAMLVGGADANVDSLSSVELYDPVSGVWSYAASLNTPRRNPAVIKLQNGKVLVAAGANGVPDGNRFLSSAEIYDPATGQWTYTGNMHVAREVGNVVMLQDGRVMVAGGEGPWLTPGNTAEIYDPATGQWTLAATMPYGWIGSSMTLLPDGRVLVAGGSTTQPPMIYDPAADAWTFTSPMIIQGDRAVLLDDGKVLLIGGPANFAHIYDPVADQWTLTGAMNMIHNAPHLAVLPNGDIFVVGTCAPESSVDIFTDPAPIPTPTPTPEPTPALVGPPTDKNQCKKDGWKSFNNPAFKNQGQCVSYTNHH